MARTPVRPQHRRRLAPAAKLCCRRSKRHRPERRRRQCRPRRHHAAALPPPTCVPRLPRRRQSRRSNCRALCEWGVPAPRVIECAKPQPAGSPSSPSSPSVRALPPVGQNPVRASPPVRDPLRASLQTTSGTPADSLRPSPFSCGQLSAKDDGTEASLRGDWTHRQEPEGGQRRVRSQHQRLPPQKDFSSVLYRFDVLLAFPHTQPAPTAVPVRRRPWHFRIR
jgi:hypothetical protein